MKQHLRLILWKNLIFIPIFAENKPKEMEEENKMQHTCVDCGTQNCKFKVRTYPEFCPTTNLKDEDLQWALERYEEGRNHDIMVASLQAQSGSVLARGG